MLGISKTSTHKVTGKATKVNGKLSAKLLDYLEIKYQLRPQDMSNLRAVYRGGHLGNLSLYLIRIYDQGKSPNFIKTYNDLDNYPNFILYAGHILDDGFTYITKCDTNSVLEAS